MVKNFRVKLIGQKTNTAHYLLLCLNSLKFLLIFKSFFILPLLARCLFIEKDVVSTEKKPVTIRFTYISVRNNESVKFHETGANLVFS